MSSDTHKRGDKPIARKVVCKPYHKSTPRSRGGLLRKIGDRKSRCPQWADDLKLRQALIDEALPDPDGAKDMFGHPKLLWNAIDGVYFLARSCNTMEPQYDCYPEYFQYGDIYRELESRSRRKLNEFTIAKGIK